MNSLAVIIPNYNNGKYLEKCIDSIMHQSLLPNEVIIVDDCSTDDSRDIITNLAKRYSILKPLFLKKNSGVSNARNTGANEAKCEFITFLDADDYYYNEKKLYNEMLFFETHPNAHVVTYSATVRVDQKNLVIEKKEIIKACYSKGVITNDLLMRINTDTIPRDYCMRKSDFISSGQYSYPRNFYEDLDLLIRLSKKSKFYFTGDYGTAYRDTPGGLSKRTKAEQISAVNTIIQQYVGDYSFFKRACYMLWKIIRKSCIKLAIVFSHKKR